MLMGVGCDSVSVYVGHSSFKRSAALPINLLILLYVWSEGCVRNELGFCFEKLWHFGILISE